jgi:hypothetical protein
MCSASPRFISLHFLGTTNSNSGTPTNRPTNTLESHSKTRIRWFVTSFLFCLLRSFGNSSSAQIETQHRRAQQYHRAHAALTCSIVTQHRFHSLRIASIYQNVARSLNNLRCYAPIRFNSIRMDSSTSIQSRVGTIIGLGKNSLFGFFCLISSGGLVTYGYLL